MEENTKQYEISVMLKTEEDFASFISLVKGKVQAIDEEHAPRRMKLAYPIRKESVAFFAWCIVTAAPGSVTELATELERMEPVLRHLLITPPIAKREERRMPDRKPEPQSAAPAPAAPVAPAPRETRGSGEAVSNELLEKKLEEILK